jgi:hypothetical protein
MQNKLSFISHWSCLNLHFKKSSSLWMTSNSFTNMFQYVLRIQCATSCTTSLPKNKLKETLLKTIVQRIAMLGSSGKMLKDSNSFENKKRWLTWNEENPWWREFKNHRGSSWVLQMFNALVCMKCGYLRYIWKPHNTISLYYSL